MGVQRPEIKATHLSRRAVAYLRQSTPFQVEHNLGSSLDQRAQSHFAIQLGWRPEQIEIIDEDLGLKRHHHAAPHRLPALDGRDSRR